MPSGHIDKHSVSLRLYDESDNKNSSGIFELTTEDKKFLSLAGDNPENNLQQGIFINEDFDPNGVFYEQIIGQSGEVYLEYSIDPTVAQYQAIFTDVGDSNGSYDIDDENNLKRSSLQICRTKSGAIFACQETYST